MESATLRRILRAALECVSEAKGLMVAFVGDPCRNAAEIVEAFEAKCRLRGTGLRATGAPDGGSAGFRRGLVLVVVAVSTVVLVSGCAGGSMTAYRLKQDAASLASFAGEGELLADAAASGRAPAPYTAAHASELGAECGDLASVVASTHVDTGRATGRAQVLRLARRTSALLERLEQDPNDAKQAARMARAFAAVSDQASKIEDGA